MAYLLQYIPRSGYATAAETADETADEADRGVAGAVASRRTASTRATPTRATIDRSSTSGDGTWPEFVPVGPGATETAVVAGA